MSDEQIVRVDRQSAGSMVHYSRPLQASRAMSLRSGLVKEVGHSSC